MIFRPFPKVRRFVLSFGSCLGLVIFLTSAPAFAHNALDSSLPIDGSTLNVSPTSWSLVFTKEVPLASASGEVVGSNGVRIPLETPTYGTTKNIIIFSLPSNLTETNTARWRLVGVDGHVISGRVGFTVLAASPSLIVPAETVASSTPPLIDVPPPIVEDSFTAPIPELPRHVLHFVNYGALLLLIGLLFVEFDIARGVIGLAVAQRTMRIASVLLTASATLQMMIFSADISGASLLGSIGSFGAVMATTPGSMLIMKVIISGFIGFVAFRQRNVQAIPQRSWWVPALLIQYLITLSYTGHSRSQRWAVLGIPADVMHTAAAGVWLGGLLVLLWIVIPHVSNRQAIQVLQRFGSAAKTAVIVLVVTGLFQTLRLHDNPWSIFTTVHGQLLLVKLLLFVGMMKFADANRRSLDMRSMNDSHVRRIKRQVVRTSIIETIFGIAVVIVTAVLVSSSLSS